MRRLGKEREYRGDAEKREYTKSKEGCYRRELRRKDRDERKEK